jgi:hypothetical protein
VPKDFPPLLTPGFHGMTLEQLHRFAVEQPRFRLSSTRQQIMRNLWTIAGCLCRWGISGELWIDGSFLTEKIDPPDVDFVVVVEETFFASATPEQESIMNWLCEDDTQPAKLAFTCDSYSLYRLPSTDPSYVSYAVLDAYWKKQFGTSRDGESKGMALIAVPGGCL